MVDPERRDGSPSDRARLDLDSRAPQAFTVTDHTAQAVADKSGVDVSYIERLAAVGILASRDGTSQ